MLIVLFGLGGVCIWLVQTIAQARSTTDLHEADP